MDLMTIGAFAERTLLSPKALRLYDRVGLLPPARTDPGIQHDSSMVADGSDISATRRNLRQSGSLSWWGTSGIWNWLFSQMTG
jgi:hypothetical protein